jgi:NAD(P)-dependent dehydrogenase (short-subunit alcohol dehydrogenase family)
MTDQGFPPKRLSPPEKLTSLFDLTGQVAVVTGGAGLLGEEFCSTLVQAGARVVIADLDTKAAQKQAEAITSIFESDPLPVDNQPDRIKPYAIPVETDVTDPSSVQNMVSVTLQTFRRLDILINCAALDPKFDPEHTVHKLPNTSKGQSPDKIEQENPDFTQAFENFPLEAWNQAIIVNLTGAFLCCQAAVKPMLMQGGGVIVNLSSIYGLVAPDQRMYQRPGQPPQYKPAYYSVTKFGILGLTQYLAAYYAGKNIRVNAISPGGVYNGHDEEFVKAYSARSVLGRMAGKDEINGALLFLVSDASKYMTGSNLVVDGGWTAW